MATATTAASRNAAKRARAPFSLPGNKELVSVQLDTVFFIANTQLPCAKKAAKTHKLYGVTLIFKQQLTDCE